MEYCRQFRIVYRKSRIVPCFCLIGIFQCNPLLGNEIGPPVRVVPQIELSESDTESDAVVLDEKLDYLSYAFDDMYPGAALWMVSWAMVSQALFAYQLIDAIQGTENWMTSRTTNIVGASQSFISLVWGLAVPFRPMSAKREFTAMAQSSEAEKKRKVRQGERLLRQADNDIALVRSWISYVANFGVCLLGGAIIWGVEGKDGWKRALISTGAGTAFTLANIWTVPNKAVKHYETYSRKFGSIASARHHDNEIQILAIPILNGVSVSIRF